MKAANKLNIYICIALIIATLAVFWEVKNFEFVNYDDKGFIIENPLIQSGITFESVQSAFKKSWGYWKPVANLSLMLDHEIYGMDPGGFHLTNLILHIANTLMLFVFLRMVTGAMWQSAFVAALFSLHPLHVESVAWITERKDVISAFFWMLSMLGYTYYLKRPGSARYVFILIALALGLMAKPMLVTLPFIFLLFDYWPLGRLKFPDKNSAEKTINRSTPVEKRKKGTNPKGKNASKVKAPLSRPDVSTPSVMRLVREKIPMMIIVALSICILLASYNVTDKDAGATGSPEFGYRVSNALVSYTKYIEKMFVPNGLAIPYPHKTIRWEMTIFSLITLLGISFVAVKTVKSRPYIAVGWFWYLGTLVPVLGLVNFGSFSMADRFTYIPLIGLFIIIAWGVPDLLSKWRCRKGFFYVSVPIILLILMALSKRQVGYWENSITLFERAIKVTSNNYVAHNNLGIALKGQGRLDEAIEQYSEALLIKPDHARAHNNLGIALQEKGKTDDAIEHFKEALRIVPDFEEVYNNLGTVFKDLGRVDDAIAHFREALGIRPDYAQAHNNLGVCLYSKGDIDGAIEQFQKAIQINPNYANAKNNLKKVLIRQNRDLF